METAARSVSDDPVSAPKNLFSYFPVEVLTATNLSPGARLLFAYIVFCSGFPNKTRPIWHARSTMARDLGISIRSVSIYLNELKKADLINRWYDEDRTMTIPKNLTKETVKRLGSTRVSMILRSAEFAQGVCRIGPGGMQILHTETDGPIQTYETAALHPQRGAKFEEDAIVRKKATKSMTDCADDASAIAETSEAKKQLKRRNLAQFNLAKQGIERWKGTKFFKFFAERCAFHKIDLGDDIENAIERVPPRYGRAMNDVIEKAKTRGLSKKQLANMIEKLLSGWLGEGGYAEMFVTRKLWRGSDISVYLIRKRIDDVMRITGFSLAEIDDSEPELKIPKRSVADLVGRLKGGRRVEEESNRSHR